MNDSKWCWNPLCLLDPCGLSRHVGKHLFFVERTQDRGQCGSTGPIVTPTFKLCLYSPLPAIKSFQSDFKMLKFIQVYFKIFFNFLWLLISFFIKGLSGRLGVVHLGRSRLICKFEVSLGVFEKFPVCAAPHSLRNIVTGAESIGLSLVLKTNQAQHKLN